MNFDESDKKTCEEQIVFHRNTDEKNKLPEYTTEYLSSLSLEQLHHALNGARRRGRAPYPMNVRAEKDAHRIKAELKRRGSQTGIIVPSAPPPPLNPSKDK